MDPKPGVSTEQRQPPFKFFLYLWTDQHDLDFNQYLSQRTGHIARVNMRECIYHVWASSFKKWEQLLKTFTKVSHSWGTWAVSSTLKKWFQMEWLNPMNNDKVHNLMPLNIRFLETNDESSDLIYNGLMVQVITLYYHSRTPKPHITVTNNGLLKAVYWQRSLEPKQISIQSKAWTLPYTATFHVPSQSRPPFYLDENHHWSESVSPETKNSKITY